MHKYIIKEDDQAAYTLAVKLIEADENSVEIIVLTKDELEVFNDTTRFARIKTEGE